MPERIETVVVGAGQAGLAASYLLSERGRAHVVLERGRVGETWRTQRWDGFYLNTPNFAQQLPGDPYQGDDPEAFAPLTEVIEYLEGYAARSATPVRTGFEAEALTQLNAGYCVETSAGSFQCRNVVVATGAYQRPTPSRIGRDAPDDLFQLHTSEYRNPAQLPSGGVLVVGSGQSGCQIADELIDARRTVYLSCGRCPWVPRRYRGRELVRWMIDTGLMDQTVDTLESPAARLACNPPVSGNDGGHDCNPRWLARRGAILLGRVTGFRGHTAEVAPDLEENLANGDAFRTRIEQRFEEYFAARELDLPEPEREPEHEPAPRIDELDLRAHGISTVLWANGFRPDYGWIDLPVFDADGWPVHDRGVTAFSGLYFVGLHWLYKRKSALFLGVGEDAEHVVSHLANTN